MKVRISPKGVQLTIEVEDDKERKLLELWCLHYDGRLKPYGTMAFKYPEDKQKKPQTKKKSCR